MKICIIGHTGFVGQAIYNYFINKHEVYGINSKTKIIPKHKFDVIINCAGNAKKYLAYENPSKDLLNNIAPFNIILQMKFKNFIHISSIDASFTPSNNYAISKLIAEKCSKLYFPNSTILRLGGLIGNNLKKNVIYDITHNKNLYVSLNSIFNFISTTEVAKIIEKIIELNIWEKTINISSCKSISVKEIINEASKYSIIFTKSEGDIKEIYKKINTKTLNKFFTTKTSLYYIKEYFKNY